MGAVVDGLVFDLDGTLCEYRRSGADVLAAAFDDVGVEPFFTVADYFERVDEFVTGNDRIEGVRADTFAVLAREAEHDSDVGRALADAYAAERDHTDVRWLPGAEAALDTLAERYSLAMVTNGDPTMQGQKRAALGVTDRFETVVHAGWEAPAKPDPTPFDIALEAMGVDARRAVTVGNSVPHDIAGAHNAGLRSVWLDRDGEGPADPTPHYRIESMRELLLEPWG